MKLAFLTGMALGACVALQAADPAIKSPIAIPKPAASTNSGPVALSNPEAAGVLKTEVDKFSYSIGLSWGKQMKAQSIDITTENLMRGLQDGLGGKKELMTDAEIKAVQDEMRKTIMAKREKVMGEMKEKNQAAADKFLEENATKEGVKKLPSGVQYKVLKEGSGPKPTAADRVSVHYKGRLINGTEFDSSYKRGPEPTTFGVSGVIRGWTEALTNMNVGSKWELYIPPNLAYGERGSQNIEPNSLLIFEVELVEIKQPEAPPQPITSDIIKVPSKAELDAGAKIEVIKQEDLAKYTNKTGNANPPKPPAPKQ
jgi:FKBP-type peptidyl-prolyl cis-trans isomerase FklB